MRFCQVLRSKGLGAVALAWAAAMPACAMPVDDGCAGLNCEPVNSAEEALATYPGLAGKRMKAPVDPSVFLIDPEGYKRWIPSSETYNNLFVDWTGIDENPVVWDIYQGPPLYQAFLAKDSNSAKVYFVSDWQKRWIINSQVFNKYHFDWGKIQVWDPASLAAIPTGPNWY